MTVVTVVKKLCNQFNKKARNLSLKKSFYSTFGKRNLTHLATDVMFSGQRFAILAMFLFKFVSSLCHILSQLLRSVAICNFVFKNVKYSLFLPNY